MRSAEDSKLPGRETLIDRAPNHTAGLTRKHEANPSRGKALNLDNIQQTGRMRDRSSMHKGLWEAVSSWQRQGWGHREDVVGEEGELKAS